MGGAVVAIAFEDDAVIDACDPLHVGSDVTETVSQAVDTSNSNNAATIQILLSRFLSRITIEPILLHLLHQSSLYMKRLSWLRLANVHLQVEYFM